MKWKNKDGMEYEGTVKEYIDWKEQENKIREIDELGNQLEMTKQEKEELSRPIIILNPSKKFIKGNPWLIGEDTILKRNFPKLGLKELQKLLPGRTRSAIDKRIWLLKLRQTKNHTSNSNKWNRHEEKIIRDNFGKISSKEIAKLLPGRSLTAVRVHICSMKPKKRRTINISEAHHQKLSNRGKFITDRTNHIMWSDKTKSRQQAMSIACAEWNSHNKLGVVVSEVKSPNIVWEVVKYDADTETWTCVDTFSNHSDAISTRDNLNKEFGTDKIKYLTKKVIV